METIARRRTVRSTACRGANNGAVSFQMGVTAAVELVVGVAHRFRARAAEHHLEVDRLEALVDVAVDHAGRAGDAFPGPAADVAGPGAPVLAEGGQVNAEDEGPRLG